MGAEVGIADRVEQVLVYWPEIRQTFILKEFTIFNPLGQI